MSQVLPGAAPADTGAQAQGILAPETEPSAPAPPRAAPKVIEGRTPFQLGWARFKKDRVAMASLVFLVLLTVAAIFAPLLVFHPPNSTAFLYQMTNAYGVPKGPNFHLHFFLGADEFGRDLLSRTLYGARVSLTIGVLATAVAAVVGIVVGMIAGFYRGAIDTGLSRLMDIMLSFPVLVFALALRAVFGAGLWIIIFVIGFVTWPYLGRIVRGQVLSLREKEFVEASRSLGASNMRIIFRDVLPNLVAPIIVYATLIIPSNIVFESTLSYLGLGLNPPTASWGSMINDAQNFFPGAPWFLLVPGIALLLTVLAFNLLGDGVRDALDPRGLQ